MSGEKYANTGEIAQGVELYGGVERSISAKDAILRIDRADIDDSQTQAGSFHKRASSQIDKSNKRRKDKWRRLVMSEDGLISYWIEGNQRWRFLREIRIGNVDDRSKSVIREIGAEDDWVQVRANAEGVDG